jgi:hypothetical protein
MKRFVSSGLEEAEKTSSKLQHAGVVLLRVIAGLNPTMRAEPYILF